MRFTQVAALSAALLLSSTAIAKDKKLASNEQPSASASHRAPAAAQPQAEKKICKRLVTSGTRMTERVCLTKQDWEKVEEEVR